MSNKSIIHDIYQRYYGDQKVETRGVKKGTVRGEYKSHMEKLSLAEKREKNRLYQRKYRKKKKMSADSLNCKDFLKTGGVSLPVLKDNAHFNPQNHSITAETRNSKGLSMVTRITPSIEKEKRGVRS